MKLILAVFTLATLALNGQSWSDAQNGNGVIGRETQEIAQLIFPTCPSEDSDWCYWDGGKNGTGDHFVSVAGVVIIFN